MRGRSLLDRIAAHFSPERGAFVLIWGTLTLLLWLRATEPGAEPIIERAAHSPPVLIDLNRDPWPRLMLLEGIGETLAQRIIAARETQGGFATLEEVQAIPGIPDEVIERARPWLVLGEVEPRVSAPPPAQD